MVKSTCTTSNLLIQVIGQWDISIPVCCQSEQAAEQEMGLLVI